MGVILTQSCTPSSFAVGELYGSRIALRLPRDLGYTPPTPDRAERGWVVARWQGMEIFRGDVNLMMDGGGLDSSNLEVKDRFTDTLVSAAATVMDPDSAGDVVNVILTRIEDLASSWVVFYLSDRGSADQLEIFHEDRLGKRTDMHYVIDLRLNRR